MSKALFLRKGAMDNIIDPHKLMGDYGWEQLPQESFHNFTMFRKPGKPGRMFIYNGGLWQLLDNSRKIVDQGPDAESLQVFLSGDRKPIEHMG
jgi:hypothetical protein